MAPIAPYEDPSETDFVDGEVVLLGPGTIATSMTPKAAEETARRLQIAARRAAAPPTAGQPEAD